MRTRASILAQVSSGEMDEDILQTGLASSKAQQVRAAILQGRQQGGDGRVGFTHAQDDPTVFHMDRLDTREPPPQPSIGRVITRGLEFHHLMPT